MKAIRYGIAAGVIILFWSACNNFFHDLIPPDGDRIESFSIPGQTGVQIGSNTISVIVPPGLALDGLVPYVRVSPGASLIPVTREYVARAFGDDRTFGAAMTIYSGGNMTEKVTEMIRGNKNFAAPALDLPVNFGYAVDFLVISARGSIRRYTVRVEEGEGKFAAFRFDKFFNPDLVRSATGVIDAGSKTITANVSYPVENIASYKLIPSFETNGARVYLDGKELGNGVSLMDFLKPPDSSELNKTAYSRQEKKLTLKQAGYADTDWALIVNFSEDPDTSRAITDFRFTRARNSLISADYMADITHGGDTGTIAVTVYYGGARPETLRANFTSPGTVRANGEIQTSAYSEQDFSSPVQYVVTSRVGNNVRVYTVTVTLLSTADPLPQITSFGFSQTRNPQLRSDSAAMIDHAGRLILIEAAYSGDSPPYMLIPDFAASGIVTVNGVTQASGIDEINFSAPVGYAVANPSNPTLKREYRVEARFVKNLSSVAEITAFGFYRADNPGLLADAPATIDPLTGAISATLLFETPGGSRTLVPRWSAQGRVAVGGITQTSGASGRQFYTPQTYTVTADSGLRRDYAVTVKEVNSRIYVRESATGLNNGNNWQNAYRNLSDACADAALFEDYAYVPKEIWIARGTYRPSSTGDIEEYFLITPNTSYIGGFAGTETAKSQRNVAANRVTVSGDLGGGRLSYNLFATGFPNSEFSWWDSYPLTIDGGNISFEDMDFNSCGVKGYVRFGGAISTSLSNDNVLKVSRCNFSNVSGNVYGGAIYISNGRYGSGDTDFHLEIDNINVLNSGYGVYFGGGNRNSTLVVRDSEFLNLEGSAIDTDYAGNVTVENVKMENTRTGIDLSGGADGSTIRVSNCSIKKTTDNDTIRASSIYVGYNTFSNVEIYNTTIENDNKVRGIFIYSGKAVVISNTVIRNSWAHFYNTWNDPNYPFDGRGGGLCFPVVGYATFPSSIIIRDSRIENCTAAVGNGAIYPASHPNMSIVNTPFINCSP